MAARARRHEDQPVHARIGGFLRMARIDHVVKHHAAIGVYAVNNVAHRAQRGDDQRNLVFGGDGQIGHQARIGLMHDQVDAVSGVVRPQRRLYLRQPFGIALRRALVQRRKRPDHPRLAGRDHQFRPRHQKHRRRDRRKAQIFGKSGGDGHVEFPLSIYRRD